MLRAFAHHVVCCCVLLRVVATCWKLLDEVWNWSNFRANKCQHFYCFAVIEAWSNNVAFVCTAHPTMLRRRTRTTCHVSTQIIANKKSTWRRRWKTSQSPLYSHLNTQHVVTCCERLHTSANIAQQETTLLGPTMLRVVARVCTGLKVNVSRRIILGLHPTWWDGHVGVQNNRKWPHKFCIIIESNSQKTFYCIVLYTNMAAVTSDENHQ